MASTYFAQIYSGELVLLVGEKRLLGIVAYTLVAVLTTVIAPLNSIPLMPIATNIWGPIITALASIVGWLIGALIAFGISRKYGRGLVEKIFSREKVDAFEKRVPQQNLFWSIVFLRMAVPVDMLSYILGLFSTISWTTYTFATLIGITPFAFVLAYTGMLPFRYQVMGMAVALIALFTLYKRK
ncbi:TVP38/TMEM64 family protein [Candidatus Kaiserbacteria bacterium]|nr:MAG: TVP38/TMEM64 family protein [Candidatus Kaiserbacteria bacterium]